MIWRFFVYEIFTPILDFVEKMDTFNPAVPTYEGGRIVKMEVDYSQACDETIPKCKEMAKNESKFNDALEQLLSLEKQSRIGSDMVSSSRVLVAIVQIIFDVRKWELLNEYIAILTKKRAQSKQAIVKMVQECVIYVDQTPDKETKIKLIDTLRTVTEGKIYVEIERARLTKILSDIKEADGDVLGAATIMEQLQIETYGTMDKREKVEFILEQMRLCLAKQDLVRTQIISKKISTKFFNDPEHQDLKLKYYNLMVSSLFVQWKIVQVVTILCFRFSWIKINRTSRLPVTTWLSLTRPSSPMMKKSARRLSSAQCFTVSFHHTTTSRSI